MLLSERVGEGQNFLLMSSRNANSRWRAQPSELYSNYCTVRVALRVFRRRVPEISGALVAVTGLVVTVNVALLLPAGIITEPGTWATLVLLLVMLTATPDGGAAPFRVKVAVDDVPPFTVLGLRPNELSAAIVTVSVVVRFTPEYEAVIVDVVWLATPPVVMVKVAVRDPAPIATLTGT